MSKEPRSNQIFITCLFSFFMGLPVILAPRGSSIRNHVIQEWWPFIIIITLSFFLYLWRSELRISKSESIRMRSTAEFTSDRKIQEIAEQLTDRAIVFAYTTFQIKLDMSDKSIKEAEFVLSYLHMKTIKDRSSFDKVYSLAQAYGSYIGEVYRNNHGAEWGLLKKDGEIFPGLQCKDGNHTFWPWAIAQNRILDGDESKFWEELIGKHNHSIHPRMTQW